MRVQLIVEIPKGNKDSLKAIARQMSAEQGRDVTMTSLVNEMITNFIGEHSKPSKLGD